MKAEDNDYLTQVEAGTPMGDYLRSQWVPVTRSARVEAGGAPIRTRLFGENYVVFRATDGRVGLVDEACPHRGASLALGRVEGCALRCLYHGWEVDVSGEFVHAVSEANGKERGPHLPLRPYPVHEVGKMIWAYLGKADTAPRFPDFEWTRDDANPEPHMAITHCNWLQAMEGTVDPNHVGFLHDNWLPEFAVNMLVKSSIEYDLEETSYGFHGVSTRYPPGMPAGLARVKEYALPFYMLVPFEPSQERTAIFAIPVDRETCNFWYLNYAKASTQQTTKGKGETGVANGLRGQPEGVSGFQYGIDARLDHYPNPDNFRESMPFDPLRRYDLNNMWGQDREKMAASEHRTGLPGLTTEDIAILESQGPIADRTKERLAKGDIMVVALRRMLVERAKAFARGETHDDSDIDYRMIRATMGFVLEGQSWRDVPRFPAQTTVADGEKPLQAAE